MIFIFLGFGFAAWAVPDFQVMPVDTSTQKILKQGRFSAQIVGLRPGTQDFREKAYAVWEKTSDALPKKDLDSVHFVYDLLFLSAAGLEKRYPQISKNQLRQARRVADEVFRK